MEQPKLTFNPTLLSELGDYEPISWFWEGFVAPKRKTIFVGHPKAGKTTLMSHLVRGLSGARCSIGPPVLPCKTLIITEEHEDLWKRRRDDMHINGDQVYLISGQRTPNYEYWNALLEIAGKFMLSKGIETLMIDTLSNVWPVMDENDAAQTGRGLDPLTDLANMGLAVVCVHHAPKQKQSAVISARGSTAITAFFDIVINMRTAGRGTHTTRRSLKGWGRDLETPETLILDYKGVEEGYEVSSGEGDMDDEMMDLDMEQVIKAIPTDGDGADMKTICGKVKMAHTTIKPLLARAIDLQRVHRDGTGLKGNPYHYFQAENGDK